MYFSPFSSTVLKPSATVTRSSAASRYLEDVAAIERRVIVGRDDLRAKESTFTEEYLAQKYSALSASALASLQASAGSAGRAIASAYRSIVDARDAAVNADEASWDHARLSTIRMELEAKFSVPSQPFAYDTLADRHMEAMREALAAGDRHMIRELHRVVTVGTDWNDPKVPTGDVRALLEKLADAIAVPEQRDAAEQLEALAIDTRAVADAMYAAESDLTDGLWRDGRSRGTGIFVPLEPSPVATLLGDVPRVEGAAPSAFDALAELHAKLMQG
jgi:hypothetical protein